MRLVAVQPPLIVVAVAALAIALAGCATSAQRELANEPPTSLQTPAYYPFQVKGYQNSYPQRRIVVLTPADARDFKEAGGHGHSPEGHNPAVGLLIGPKGVVVQRVYTAPLAPIVQGAIARSAEEAGMIATVSSETLKTALKTPHEDYVLASRITRCWVNKRSTSDTKSSSLDWSTSATVSLDISIYKPPFSVPFWQGISSTTYNDPPADKWGGVGDDVPIYDKPGQVLSVALTRAVAGIFKREALHALILHDMIRRR